MAWLTTDELNRRGCLPVVVCDGNGDVVPGRIIGFDVETGVAGVLTEGERRIHFAYGHVQHKPPLTWRSTGPGTNKNRRAV